MTTYRVKAVNTATESANKIHDDQIARRYGFAGGLVPGVTVFAYMTRPVVELLGAPWLERGTIRARFVQPVYDGEQIEVEARPLGREPAEGIEVTVRNQAGQICAEGNASLVPTASAVPDPRDYPANALVDSPPAASAEAFANSSFLGAVQGAFTTESAAAFLALIGDDLPVYPERGIAHPGWLLLWANLALTSNFRLGPWIHVSSDVQYFALVGDGDRLSTRGRVARIFEKKGHRFVELDLLTLTDDERVVMAVRHVAIYEPRRIVEDR